MTNPLIPRLREGEGADRTLDKMIAVSYGGLIITAADNHPPYTSSLDACIALAEKVLPGHILRLWRIHDYVDSWPTVTFNGRYEGNHKDLPRAFLIALITAKEAEHDR